MLINGLSKKSRVIFIWFIYYGYKASIVSEHHTDLLSHINGKYFKVLVPVVRGPCQSCRNWSPKLAIANPTWLKTTGSGGEGSIVIQAAIPPWIKSSQVPKCFGSSASEAHRKSTFTFKEGKPQAQISIMIISALSENERQWGRNSAFPFRVCYLATDYFWNLTRH